MVILVYNPYSIFDFETSHICLRGIDFYYCKCKKNINLWKESRWLCRTIDTGHVALFGFSVIELLVQFLEFRGEGDTAYIIGL